MKRTALVLCAAVLMVSGCAGTLTTMRTSEYPYGITGEATPGRIIHLPTGLDKSFEEMMAMLSGSRLVAIGETHDNIHAHEVELAVIRGLAERFPGQLAIGMEMFREPQQAALDRWVAGELSEIEFLRASKWYQNWSSDYSYYRDILVFAKENRIDVVALNPSKELQMQVSRAGLDKIPEELAAQLPEIDDSDPFQRGVAKAVYGDHLPTKGMFASFYRVQVLWEEYMAERVVDYLKSPSGEGKKMVILTGGWHSQYGFGVPKKVIRRLAMPYSIVIPEELNIPEDKVDQLMHIDLPEIPLLKADFIWLVNYEGVESKRVKLGVMIRDKEGKVMVEGVEKGSPADKAGVLKGDRIVSLGGNEVVETTDIFYHVATWTDGDTAPLVVERNGGQVNLSVTFFKMPKQPRRRPAPPAPFSAPSVAE